MGQEFVPEIVGELGADTCENGEKVVFEGLDAAFCDIAPVDVWGNELKGAVPILGDCPTILGTCFVVQNLVVNSVPIGFEALHNAMISWKSMAVMTRLKGLDKNCIRVAVVSEHDVLITTARSYREATHVVSIQLADGLCPDEDFIGWRRSWGG